MITTLLATTFVIAREGLEAWLIAVLAITAANNNPKHIKVIIWAVLGSILAIIALGTTTAQLLGNHANTERFEGFIGVITGVVLAWVAWFCHSASQHVKALPFGNSLLLGLAVFGIMFREGVEVVIFLTGIIIDSQDIQMVYLGILAGLVILVTVSKIMYNQITKLPIKNIFKISRWIFSILAVYFLYTGISEIIEYGIWPQ